MLKEVAMSCLALVFNQLMVRICLFFYLAYAFEIDTNLCLSIFTCTCMPLLQSAI